MSWVTTYQCIVLLLKRNDGERVLLGIEVKRVPFLYTQGSRCQ